MESSESPDSKNVKTISDGQASSSGNDQAIAAQPRHGNIDEQRPESGNINEQQPGNNAAMNPCSNQQALPNQIANVPNDNVDQQHQQLLNNDLNPPQPINELQQNGPNDQPRRLIRRRRRRRLLNPRNSLIVIRRRVPHFHCTFGNYYWTYNDYSQRVPVRVLRQPPMRDQPRQQVNICQRLPMNDRLPTTVRQQNGQENPGPSNPPPLVFRKEIEPGIFQEIYSHREIWANRTTMFGVDRCVCENFVNYNRGNSEMITVIMNTPNLTLRYSMTTSYEAQFEELFDAYFGLTLQTARTVFVACGQRLRRYDTPRDIGMKNRDNIYAFIGANGYQISKKTRKNSK